MAPRTTSRGAKSPPIASTAMRTSAIRRGRTSRSALPLCRRGHLDRHRLAAVVVAARRADVVGALQLVTVVAFDQRRSADSQVRAALALACFRYLSLGDAHANNSLEADHGRLKARLRPMRGLKRDRTARVVVVGHTFVQNLRRGFYDPGTDVPPASRLANASAELAVFI